MVCIQPEGRMPAAKDDAGGEAGSALDKGQLERYGTQDSEIIGLL